MAEFGKPDTDDDDYGEGKTSEDESNVEERDLVQLLSRFVY